MTWVASFSVLTTLDKLDPNMPSLQQQQMKILKLLLNIFYKLSGLKVNLHKSELLVTSDANYKAATLATILQCTQSISVPHDISRLTPFRQKAYVWTSSIEKIRNRLTSWKRRCYQLEEDWQRSIPFSQRCLFISCQSFFYQNGSRCNW